MLLNKMNDDLDYFDGDSFDDNFNGCKFIKNLKGKHVRCHIISTQYVDDLPKYIRSNVDVRINLV